MSDASSMYHVEEAPRDLWSMTLNHRQPVKPTLHTWAEYHWLRRSVADRYGLEAFRDCLMGEMSLRPIPHVFPRSKVQALLELYRRRILPVLKWAISKMTPPWQSLNPDSRLGWPIIKTVPSKRAALQPLFAEMLDIGPARAFGAGWVQVGMRLQPEEQTKKRTGMFVDEDGNVVEREIGPEMRRIFYGDGDDSQEFFSARHRAVFNYPGAGNLYAQPLDTALHNVYISTRMCGHDLNTRGGHREPFGVVVAGDAKQFDRYTAPCWRLRAELIGGLYADIVSTFASLPFHVRAPGGSSRKTFFVWPNAEAGAEVQFGSGASAVAPIQKEIFICLYQEFAETVMGVSPAVSLDWVLGGGDARFSFMNYGDDNLWFGQREYIDKFFEFVNQYIDMVEEVPTKFLGFLWTQNGFKLGVSSYLLKTYWNEREPKPPFRPYPHYGWVEKRRVYREKGVPELEEVFQFEDSLLAQTSFTWDQIQARAVVEAAIQARHNAALSERARAIIATEKQDYQLTAEELVTQMGYEGYTPKETAPMILRLLDKSWHSLLSWRS